MPSKISFAAGTVASAATAFGLGALAFSGNPEAPETATSYAPPLNTPDADDSADATAAPITPPSTAPTTLPGQSGTTSVRVTTAPRAEPTKAKHAKPAPVHGHAEHAKPPKHAKPKPPKHAKPKDGSEGPFKDAQGDGKVLDDLGADLGLPHGIDVPDELLPFPGPGYTGAPIVISTQEEADTFAQSHTFNPDDVVSAPNVITDPGKPWLQPSTPLIHTGVVSAEPSTPAAGTEPTGPVRNTGLVTGTRPHFF